MTDKIRKLLTSRNFEDHKIALSILTDDEIDKLWSRSATGTIEGGTFFDFRGELLILLASGVIATTGNWESARTVKSEKYQYYER